MPNPSTRSIRAARPAAPAVASPPAGSPRSPGRRGPAGPPVPVTIWPVPTPVPAAPGSPCGQVLTAGLAEAILTAYTQPGQLICDVLCTTPVVLLAAARTGRPAAGLPANRAAAALAAARLDAELTVDQRALVDLHPPGWWTGQDPPTDLTGKVDAIITSPTYPAICQLRNQAEAAEPGEPGGPGGTCPDRWGAQSAPADWPGGDRPLSAVHLAGYAAVTAALYTRAAPLLRPGGLLITVTVNPRRDGRLVDLTALTVRLAGAAGLSYLQHVIALTAPITGGQLQPAAAAQNPGEPVPGRDQTQAPAQPGCGPARFAGCRQVHTDITVFRNPAGSGAGKREAGRD